MSTITTSSSFDRSPDQRLAALQNANRIRVYRAQMKKDIKRRTRDPLAILLNPPAEIETMKVLSFILAMPRVGRVKANKTLQRTRIAPSKTIGGMSPRQRAELVGTLRCSSSNTGRRPA